MWKSKGLSDGSIKPSAASNNTKIRLTLGGNCLRHYKSDIISK